MPACGDGSSSCSAALVCCRVAKARRARAQQGPSGCRRIGVLTPIARHYAAGQALIAALRKGLQDSGRRRAATSRSNIAGRRTSIIDCRRLQLSWCNGRRP